MSKSIPSLITGDNFIDERGLLSFFPEFDFLNVKRCYIVENFSKSLIRGFHGHKIEEKYALVSSGSALFKVVKMDSFPNPSKKNSLYGFTLSYRKPEILHIPAGFAHGFRALEQCTKIIFFSTATLSQSKQDDFRIPYDYYGKEIWVVKNR